MRYFQRFGFSAAAALLVIGCSGEGGEEPGPTVDEVIERHIDAIGGAAAIDAVDNIQIQAEVIEPEFTVGGAYRATRDGQMRVDIYVGGDRVFSEGIDADGSWQQGGEGAEFTETTPLARAALSHGVDFNLFGLHDFAARGHRASLFGREEIDGVNYYVIHLAMEDGFERFYFINPDTWLIERHREVSALHPDLDAEERPAETIQSNFQESCGVLRPTETQKIDRETGEEMQRTRTISSTCNAERDSLNIGRNEPALPPG